MEVECHNNNVDGRGVGGTAAAMFNDNYYKIESPRYVFQITDFTANGNEADANDEKSEEKKEYAELKPADAAVTNYSRRIGGCYDDSDEFLIEELISEKNILDYDHDIESSQDENSLDDEYFDYYGPIITVESINYINGIITTQSNTEEVSIEDNDSNPFKCTRCKSAFKTSLALINHFEDAHENVHLNYVNCVICSEAFESVDDMKNHMRMHKDAVKRPFSCRECGKRFKTLAYCQNHEENRMCNATEFVCVTCGKEFPNNYGLVRHSVVHTSERRHSCTLCEKYFKTENNLLLHMKWHKGEKPFKCSKCPKAFGNRGHLQYHQKNHNENLPFSCEFCQKGFSVKERLERHIRIHLSKKRYECPVCGKKFLAEDKLKRHLQVHITANDTMKCRVCQKDFSAIRFLLRHMTMVHHIKILSSLSTIKLAADEEEIVIKKKRRPYGSYTKGNFCDLCNTTFKTPRYLGKHRRTVHSDVYPDSESESFTNSTHNSTNDSSQLDDSSQLGDSSQIDEEDNSKASSSQS